MGAEVFLFDPSGAFIVMSSFRPLPQNFEGEVVYGAKDRFADHVPVILNPTPYDGVEQPYQVLGLGLQVGLHEVSDFPQE